MSDTMLLGVLRMPVDDHGDLSLMQLISRAREAADRIEIDADRIAELEQWQRDMVAKAAEQSLGGYREMGQRAAKAESERDEAFAKGKQVFEDLRRVEAERDALAAHVERLASWIKDHGWHADTCGILDVDDEGRHMACTCGLSAINEAPATSLARLKAEWQAEALEEALRRMKGTCYGELRIEDYMEELRRQAEGGDHD